MTRERARAERAPMGAERAGAVAKRGGRSREGARERAPAVEIPGESHDIGDALHISRVTYVNIKVTGHDDARHLELIHR